ncbi:MAG: SLC13 family permease [Chloroflexi bacterium]|nr:SLC13 family permease [Chloroflexota bacterium]
MTSEIGLLLLIIAVSLVLFAFEWVSADVVALGVLLSLILTGLLPTDMAFAGFGSDAVMMILGLLILTASLTRTGVVDMAGRAIIRQTGDNPNRLLMIVVIASAVLGAFMSNTASTAFFVPVVIGLANRLRVSPSKLLMPLAFASILTSSVTLISTSTNIIVSNLMTRSGQRPMGMFELAPVGIPIAIVGLIYMLTLGRRLIPDRTRPVDTDDGNFGMRQYLTEVVVLPESPLVGKTLAESALGKELDLNVVRVVRDKKRYIIPQASTVLQEGDVLMVEGQREEILRIKETAGIDIKADFKLADPELSEEDIRLIEAIILPRSPLIGRTLKGFRFRERYGVQVLAINRHSETIRRKISQVRLQIGDVLLLQGHRANIAALDDGYTLNILNAVTEPRPNRQRAALATIIFVGALLAATFNLLPLAVAVLVGALLAFVTRCITPEEAYREIEWKALILIGSMLALGAAMEYTGTAEFLAQQMVNFAGHLNPLWLLAAFFVLTVVLTQPMSNQAAAIVVVPIALQTAAQLGLNPRSFAMMIAVAASCSYLTPLEPSCLMVYAPGNYRFFDFMKVGSFLTVLIFALALVLVPIVWPL